MTDTVVPTDSTAVPTDSTAVPTAAGTAPTGYYAAVRARIERLVCEEAGWRVTHSLDLALDNLVVAATFAANDDDRREIEHAERIVHAVIESVTARRNQGGQ